VISGAVTTSPIRVYLARSHRWLHAKLLEQAVLPSDVELVQSPDDASLIIYPEPPWKDSEAPDRLRDFTLRQLSRTFVYSQDDTPVPWAPGMYASLRNRTSGVAAAFSGGFYVVHHLRESGGLREHLESAASVEPDLLWSFVGTMENAPVRGRIAELQDARAIIADTQRFSSTLRWGWASDHRDEAQEAFREYAITLARSKFVVCPRGRGPSSMRIFEALEVGRCPVIVADDWLPPPFADWDSCAIRVPERNVNQLPQILRSRESEAAALGANARAVWEQFFSPRAQLATLVMGCLEISERIGTGTRIAAGVAALGEQSTRQRVASNRHRLVPKRLRAAVPGKHA